MSDLKAMELIAQLVPKGSRVLDLGCGNGALLAHLRDTRQCSGYGIEIDDANVLACTHTSGGTLHRRKASPRTRVASTRDVRISARFSGVGRQSTVRPARLIKAEAPSNARHHSPGRGSTVAAPHRDQSAALIRDGVGRGTQGVAADRPVPDRQRCRQAPQVESEVRQRHRVSSPAWPPPGGTNLSGREE